MANGYKRIKMDNHPSAPKDGLMKIHRLVAEGYLGRYLRDEEVVHHINNNNHDNRIENLIVFENEGYHQRYHRCQPGYTGIVLYGPKCTEIKKQRYKQLAEKTKKAMRA